MAKHAPESGGLKSAAVVVLVLMLWACRAGPPPSFDLSCAGDSLMRPMPSYFRQLLRSPDREPVLHDWSRSGLSTATYRGFYLQNAPAWRRIRPEAILLQIGTNDVPAILEGQYSLEDFGNNLALILREFASYRSGDGRRAALLVATVPLFSDTPENIKRNDLVRSRLNPRLRQVAREAGAAVVDNCAVLEDRPELYDPDGVHPNSLGEAALARNWTRSLRRTLSAARDGGR